MARYLLATIMIAGMFALAVPGAGAQSDGKPPAARPSDALADGEIRKVDKDANKLTIRHGPLPQLDMPAPMTMVYQVKDPALLGKVKAGDKVRFAAEKIGGAYTVTHIETAQ